MVADIHAGPESGLSADTRHSGFTKYRRRLFFIADDGIRGREVWRTNVNGDNPHILRNVTPREFDRYETLDHQMATVNGYLVFSKIGDRGRQEIWRTTGRNSSTQLVRSMRREASISNFTVVNDTLFFSAAFGDGEGLWKSDGNSVRLLKDINPDGYAALRSFTDFSNELYFVADDGIHGREIWKTNGTRSGAVMLGDYYSATSNPLREGQRDLTVYNDKLYFVNYRRSSGSEIWATDGTRTRLVEQTLPGRESGFPRELNAIGGRLYYEVRVSYYGRELRVLDL